jgi:hypothetical protein
LFAGLEIIREIPFHDVVDLERLAGGAVVKSI